MNFRLIAAVFVVCLSGVCSAAEEPRIENPSFEADVFGNSPGVARLNGGKISGWQFRGNVGINPFWTGAPQRTGPQRPFVDNGVTPHGRQVALMQNHCTLSQQVPGLQAGRQYVVTYYENARHMRRIKEPPRLVVILGGETIVSEHEVRSVDDPDQFTLPYDFVESAPFTAPTDGSFELALRTTVDGGVTVLVDQVTISETSLNAKSQAAARRPEPKALGCTHCTPPHFTAYFGGFRNALYSGHSIRCASYRGHFQAGQTGLSF